MDARSDRYVRRSVDAGEVRLAAGTWSGTEPTLVALHGLTGTHLHFVGLATHLQERAAIWAPDLRGRGGSDKPAQGPYGMPQHAADVAAAMRRLGLGPSVIVGHSMGAYVGAELAARNPDLVAGLVMLDGGYLLDPPPDLDPDLLLEFLLKPQVDRLRMTFASRQEYLDYWRALPALPPEAWSAWIEALLDYDLGGEEPNLRPRHLERAVREDFASMADKAAATERLRALRCPVLVIRAQDGVAFGQPPVIPDTVMSEIRACLPDVEERLLAGTNHYTILLAEPGVRAVADLIDSFSLRCLAGAALPDPTRG